MALGIKTGGRRAGTPNKRSLALCDKLAQLNLDPLAELVEMTKSQDVTVELRARILMDLMGYVYPKRKALQTRPPGMQPVVFNIDLGNHKAEGEIMESAVSTSKVDAQLVEVKSES
jgi:hypothetical protein